MYYCTNTDNDGIEREGVWYIYSRSEDRRLGYGFMDCTSQLQAQTIVNFLNAAYNQGWAEAQKFYDEAKKLKEPEPR